MGANLSWYARLLTQFLQTEEGWPGSPGIQNLVPYHILGDYKETGTVLISR